MAWIKAALSWPASQPAELEGAPGGRESQATLREYHPGMEPPAGHVLKSCISQAGTDAGRGMAIMGALTLIRIPAVIGAEGSSPINCSTGKQPMEAAASSLLNPYP